VSDTEASCPSCGHVNSPDAKFCAECGAILPPRKSDRAVPPSEPSPWERQIGEPSPPRRREQRGLIAAAAVAIVVLAGILIAIQQHRRSGAIPVPGAPAREETATPAPIATATLPPTPIAALPTAPPHRERADAGERRPRTPSPQAERAQPRRERPGPGWYRVRYRAPLFRDPNETSPVIAYLPAGSKVHVTRVLPGFLAVESVTGKPPGYLSSDDASPDSAP
jgi:hypothetical protein